MQRGAKKRMQASAIRSTGGKLSWRVAHIATIRFRQMIP